MVPSIGAWAELAAELKRRREELATKQSSAAQAASVFPPSSPCSHLTPGQSPTCPHAQLPARSNASANVCMGSRCAPWQGLLQTPNYNAEEVYSV